MNKHILKSMIKQKHFTKNDCDLLKHIFMGNVVYALFDITEIIKDIMDNEVLTEEQLDDWDNISIYINDFLEELDANISNQDLTKWVEIIRESLENIFTPDYVVAPTEYNIISYDRLLINWYRVSENIERLINLNKS